MLALAIVFYLSVRQLPKVVINLPTSKLLLSPAAGDPQRIGSFPTAIALSPDGRYAAFLENGYGTPDTNLQQGIAVLDFDSGNIKEFPDDRFGKRARQSFFLGLAFSSDGKLLYASVGSISDPTAKQPDSLGNGIAVYAFNSGELCPDHFMPIPLQRLAKGKKQGAVARDVPPGMAIPYPAGIAVFTGAEGDNILVADNLSDDALIVHAATGKILQRFDLSTNEIVPASLPYGALVNRARDRAWVSLWNASSVAELDLKQGRVARTVELHAPKSRTTAGSHPTAMLLSKSGAFLFVALANTDEVAVVDTTTGQPVKFVSAKLPGQKYQGAYPNALALSGDGGRLFVANASSDAVAVLNIAESVAPCSGDGCPPATNDINVSTAGFIPTEWYPTAVAVRGQELLIATGKSHGTGPNDRLLPASVPASRNHRQYIATLLHGSIARMNLSGLDSELPQFTREVMESNLMNGRRERLPFAGDKNPIKHVIYVIKENRTYDQIFGDLEAGDGDPSLTMYGEEITPNQHKLARQFGVLDNFYDSGEVSGDGHVWSTAAISSDYTERVWQINYRGKERTYDFEGGALADYPILQGIPDVNEPGTGYLWGNVARHGLTYRDYGEYIFTRWCDRGDEQQPPQAGPPLADAKACPNKMVAKGQPLTIPGETKAVPSPWSWPVPIMAEQIATKPELRGHFDPQYPSFRMDYPDQLRMDEFLREFNGWLKQRRTGTSDAMPQLVVLRLPNDHTSGTTPGVASPAAAVADNDLALGRLVDAISHSAYWDDTAILVLEDDAQDGADHVDAHRSIALVISKYAPRSPRPFVDHRFYTTVNMIHTLEVLLGLPPMNNNDAQAPVMAPMFTGSGDQPPFTADYRNRDNGLLYQMNPPKAAGAKESAAMDFTHADAVDTALLNRILWRDRKGNQPMPSPKHGLVMGTVRAGDD